MRLGIDFGTTRTVVAVSGSGRHPLATFEADERFRDFVPGLAAIGADGRLVFGWEAVHVLRSGARAGVRSLKRVVSGMSPDESVSGFDLSALELVSAYLAHVRELLETASNLELEPGEALEAMVSVPANATAHQRYLTLEAFRGAGFEVVGMLNEPSAAAIEYGYRHTRALSPRSPKRYVVVYDLGGGTFDSSGVSLDGRKFELLCSEGIARLGGDDFDEILLAMVLEALGGHRGVLGESSRAALLEVCREAKEGLHPNSQRIMVDASSQLAGSEPVVLHTADLYRRCQPVVERTLECVEHVFSHLVEHGIDPENTRELGAVYLVGGAVAFPAVARSLRERYGRKLLLAPQPHASTAIGLAVAGDLDQQILVREAVTRHFGVWREARAGHQKVFDPIFAKNSTAAGSPDLLERRIYRPAHRVGHLRFLECTRLDPGGEPAGDVTPLGEVRFPYDPALVDSSDLAAYDEERTDTPAADEVAETYRYGPDGRISVEIENRTRGYRRSYLLGRD